MPQRQHENCTVDGCTRAHKSRGYCQTHYMQWKRGVPIAAEIKSRQRQKPVVCSTAGCSEPVKAKGLCKMHYARLLRHGHTKNPDRTKPYQPCSITGCDNHLYAKGVCHQHYRLERRLRERYGLTPERFAGMHAEQNGVCAICRKPPRKLHRSSMKVVCLCVDHNHTTGLVRGLLCDHCNRALGLLGDDLDVLRSAIAYLGRFAAPAPQSS